MDTQVNNITHMTSENGVLLYIEVPDGTIYHASIYAGQILYVDALAKRFERDIKEYAVKRNLL